MYVYVYIYIGDEILPSYNKDALITTQEFMECKGFHHFSTDDHPPRLFHATRSRVYRHAGMFNWRVPKGGDGGINWRRHHGSIYPEKDPWDDWTFYLHLAYIYGKFREKYTCNTWNPMGYIGGHVFFSSLVQASTANCSTEAP